MFAVKAFALGLILLLVFCFWAVSMPNAERNVIRAEHLTENSQLHQCRFWAMIASSLPETVVLNHLLNSTYSLKNLGVVNNDGWGLAYYDDSQPVVLRGEMSAYKDPDFTLAAQELATSGARIGVGHVRLAASGAFNIPNPHPFMRYKAGKWWAFGHNGVLSKTKLKNLIGPEYLAENPPQVGDNWDDPDVVDSDLYMLYILKCIEENNWVVTDGIAKAVTDINEVDSSAMNFFFTDGETVWGFRRGNTLYYYYNATFQQYSAIASQPPTSIQDGWIALYDYSLVILTANDPPSVISDIRAISEFPTSLILPLFVMATLGAAAIYRKRRLSSP